MKKTNLITRLHLLLSFLLSYCFVLLSLNPAWSQEVRRSDTATTVPKNNGTPALIPPLIWGPAGEWKLQLHADQRLRVERRDNYDLNKRKADNDDLACVRTRVNFDISYRSLWRVYLEFADARQIGARTELMQEAYWHLHQLFLEAKWREDSPWSLRIGRQAMPLGDQRLVEYGSWSNLLRLFDGTRLRYKTSDVDVSFFVVQPDIYHRRHKPALTTDDPHPMRHAYFYGVYSTLSWWKPQTVDLYLMGLSDRETMRTFPTPMKSEAGHYGTCSRYTAGARLYGPLWERAGKGKLGYEMESAYQWGNLAEDDVRAAMFHADVHYTWDAPWKPKLKLEGNMASGDREFGDGEINTFSPLFGTTHSPYGIIDFVRLQNLRELALIFSFEPTTKFKLQAEAHHYWLDSRTDAWYNGPGLRDKTGQSGRDLGDELSLVATYKLSKRMTLEGGFAHFFPGGYPRKHGKADGANFAYLQYVINF